MADKLPFEKIFPYFSYRWRYDDGQYSPYAPFTKVQFVSKEPDVDDYFKKGHNTSIANDLKVINLKDIPKGGPDVVAIDILYRESISTTVYILKTIEIPEKERGDGGLESLQITERSFEAALPNDQLSRHYDNVPRTAKAQEITANRLMYGNYKQKFNMPNSFKVEVGTFSTSLPKNGPSVKTNRSYDIAVAYSDEYGRLSNLVKQTSVEDAKEGSSFSTAFSYKNRINLTAKIKSEPPAWAKYYRYYVKDTSNKHFNLTAFNVYNDGTANDDRSDNVYLQFNSDDRNKITDDTILIPRRYDFEGSEIIFTGESRHPVLDIENEAPNIVINQVNERTVVPFMSFTERRGSIKDDGGAGNGAAATPSVGAGETSQGDTTIYFSDEADRIFTAETSNLNKYIADQDPDETTVFDVANGTPSAQLNNQVIDVSSYPERLALRFVPVDSAEDSQYKTDLILVNTITFICAGGQKKRNVYQFDLGERINEDGDIIPGTGLSKGGHRFDGDDPTMLLRLYKLGVSEEGREKLKGSFFVKVPREVANNSNILNIPTGQTEFDEDGKVSNIKEINFETEPIDESNLDLYWEAGKTFPMAAHGKVNIIEWSNCIASKAGTTGSVYLESLSIFDKFNSVEIAKGTRVLAPLSRYAEEIRKSGLIFSGLYNSKTGLNELNQFNESLGITKELEPNYGGIQKLYTLDTNLLAFCEDKVFRILADKDALFNADEGVNVTATNLVLGQAMVYQGEYGISTHPESFAFWGNNAYFTDAKRGVVMQLTPANGQLFPISSRGMSNFFRDRIGTANKLIGAYDGAKKQYVLSMQGYNQYDPSIGSETIPNETSNITLGYSLRSEGWTSRFSFIPESGITMASKFYTFKNGKAYLHNSSESNRNTFYGVLTNSLVELVFNDNPMAVKEFLTLSYEGTSGWDVIRIDTESDDAALVSTWPFVKKENKYFAPIVAQENYYGSNDQGLGSAAADDGSTVYIQGTRDKSGIKGFYNKIILENDSTSTAELFAVNTENFISQT